MAPKKAKGKQKQEEKQPKAVHQGVTLVDPRQFFIIIPHLTFHPTFFYLFSRRRQF